MVFRITIFLFFFFYLPSSAYYTKITIWSLPKEIARGKTAYLLYDLHNYSRALNEMQTDYFQKNISLMGQFDLIMEDQADSSEEFRRKKHLCSPAELRTACEQAGTSVKGMEFRWLRRNAWQDCLKAVTFNKPEQFQQLNELLIKNNCTMKLLAHEFFQAFITIKEQITLLTGNQVIPLAFIAKLEAVCDALYNNGYSELLKWQDFDGTLLEYCQKNNCLTKSYLDKCLLFDTQLLDVWIVLSLLESKSSTVLISAGGNHCARLEEYFVLLNATCLVTKGEIATANFPLNIPEGLSATESLRYLMYSEKLFRTDDLELTPVDLNIINEYFTELH